MSSPIKKNEDGEKKIVRLDCPRPGSSFGAIVLVYLYTIAPIAPNSLANWCNRTIAPNCTFALFH